jgi:hypothetical protein
MVCQKTPPRNAGVTPGTKRQDKQAQAFAPNSVGSQSGNRPGTTGNSNLSICSQCSQSSPLPGTATAPVVAGCSRCSRCDPGQQQVARSNMPAKAAALDLAALGAFIRQSQPATTKAEAASNSNLPVAQWLELLAAVLGCSPSWLLESGRVNTDDLAARGNISDAARLIHSHEWTTPPRPQFSPPITDTRTTEVAPAWLAARDNYLSHVMACHTCRVHLPKSSAHCPTGAELRARYDHKTPHNITSTLETLYV